jgi:hypothetical protein
MGRGIEGRYRITNVRSRIRCGIRYAGRGQDGRADDSPLGKPLVVDGDVQGPGDPTLVFPFFCPAPTVLERYTV